MNNVAGHFFTTIFVVFFSLWSNCSSLFHILIGFFIIKYFEEYFIYSEYKTFIRTCIWTLIMSETLACLLIFLAMLLEKQDLKTYFVVKFIFFFFFSFMDSVFCILMTLPILKLQSLTKSLPQFLPEALYFCFVFSLIIYCKVIFLYIGGWDWDSFFLTLLDSFSIFFNCF